MDSCWPGPFQKEFGEVLVCSELWQTSAQLLQEFGKKPAMFAGHCSPTCLRKALWIWLSSKNKSVSPRNRMDPKNLGKTPKLNQGSHLVPPNLNRMLKFISPGDETSKCDARAWGFLDQNKHLRLRLSASLLGAGKHRTRVNSCKATAKTKRKQNCARSTHSTQG